MPQMIIANRLVDGIVVFLGPEDAWEPAIAAGVVIDDDAEAERLLSVAKQHEARCLVIDPTLIQVKVDDGQVRPTEIREVIRAFGPTVRTDLTDVDRPHDETRIGIAPEADRRSEGATRVRRNTKE
jgi:hypothetical protein